MKVSVEQVLEYFGQMPFDQFLLSKNSFEFDIAEFGRIIELVKDGSVDGNRYIGCLALRKLLSMVTNPPYQQTVEANVIHNLIANA